MKTCSVCGLSKSVQEYHKSPRCALGVQPKCKACTKRYSKKWYNEGGRQKIVANNRTNSNARRQLICEYLEKHPCTDCRESDILVLEFDHLHSKEGNISAMVAWGYSWSRILREIEKCEVVCANCHRKRTALRSNNFRVGFRG